MSNYQLKEKITDLLANRHDLGVESADADAQDIMGLIDQYLFDSVKTPEKLKEEIINIAADYGKPKECANLATAIINLLNLATTQAVEEELAKREIKD